MTTATVEIPTYHLVKTFVSAPRKMLIGGKWLDAASGKIFPTYNPATDETLANVGYNIFDAALHFGGYKQSGWGREMGHDTLELYTEVKAVTVRL